MSTPRTVKAKRSPAKFSTPKARVGLGSPEQIQTPAQEASGPAIAQPQEVGEHSKAAVTSKVQTEFARLVADGKSPNTAAAAAISEVGKQAKTDAPVATDKLPTDSSSGAVKVGSPQPSEDNESLRTSACPPQGEISGVRYPGGLEETVNGDIDASNVDARQFPSETASKDSENPTTSTGPPQSETSGVSAAQDTEHRDIDDSNVEAKHLPSETLTTSAGPPQDEITGMSAAQDGLEQTEHRDIDASNVEAKQLPSETGELFAVPSETALCSSTLTEGVSAVQAGLEQTQHGDVEASSVEAEQLPGEAALKSSSSVESPASDKEPARTEQIPEAVVGSSAVKPASDDSAAGSAAPTPSASGAVKPASEDSAAGSAAPTPSADSLSAEAPSIIRSHPEDELLLDELVPLMRHMPPQDPAETPEASGNNKVFEIQLEKTTDKLFGVNVKPKYGKLLVDKVEPGLVDDWNKLNPCFQVLPGSYIVRVNDVGEGDPQKLIDCIVGSPSLTISVMTDTPANMVQVGAAAVGDSLPATASADNASSEQDPSSTVAESPCPPDAGAHEEEAGGPAPDATSVDPLSRPTSEVEEASPGTNEALTEPSSAVGQADPVTRVSQVLGEDPSRMSPRPNAGDSLEAGQSLEFYSRSASKWIRCQVLQVADSGDVELSVKRGYSYPVAEARRRLRTVGDSKSIAERLEEAEAAVNSQASADASLAQPATEAPAAPPVENSEPTAEAVAEETVPSTSSGILNIAEEQRKRGLQAIGRPFNSYAEEALWERVSQMHQNTVRSHLEKAGLPVATGEGARAKNQRRWFDYRSDNEHQQGLVAVNGEAPAEGTADRSNTSNMASGPPRLTPLSDIVFSESFRHGEDAPQTDSAPAAAAASSTELPPSAAAAPARKAFAVHSKVIRKKDGSRGTVRSNKRGWIKVHLDDAPRGELISCRENDLFSAEPSSAADGQTAGEPPQADARVAGSDGEETAEEQQGASAASSDRALVTGTPVEGPPASTEDAETPPSAPPRVPPPKTQATRMNSKTTRKDVQDFDVTGKWVMTDIRTGQDFEYEWTQLDRGSFTGEQVGEGEITEGIIDGDSISWQVPPVNCKGRLTSNSQLVDGSYADDETGEELGLFTGKRQDTAPKALHSRSRGDVSKKVEATLQDTAPKGIPSRGDSSKRAEATTHEAASTATAVVSKKPAAKEAAPDDTATVAVSKKPAAKEAPSESKASKKGGSEQRPPVEKESAKRGQQDWAFSKAREDSQTRRGTQSKGSAKRKAEDEDITENDDDQAVVFTAKSSRVENQAKASKADWAFSKSSRVENQAKGSKVGNVKQGKKSIPETLPPQAPIKRRMEDEGENPAPLKRQRSSVTRDADRTTSAAPALGSARIPPLRERLAAPAAKEPRPYFRSQDDTTVLRAERRALEEELRHVRSCKAAAIEAEQYDRAKELKHREQMLNQKISALPPQAARPPSPQPPQAAPTRAVVSAKADCDFIPASARAPPPARGRARSSSAELPPEPEQRVRSARRSEAPAPEPPRSARRSEAPAPEPPRSARRTEVVHDRRAPSKDDRRAPSKGPASASSAAPPPQGGFGSLMNLIKVRGEELGLAERLRQQARPARTRAGSEGKVRERSV